MWLAGSGSGAAWPPASCFAQTPALQGLLVHLILEKGRTLGCSVLSGAGDGL